MKHKAELEKEQLAAFCSVNRWPFSLPSHSSNKDDAIAIDAKFALRVFVTSSMRKVLEASSDKEVWNRLQRLEDGSENRRLR